jgi:5'-deoxynucleotidase YfbR-like HD superfamily hydrolase
MPMTHSGVLVTPGNGVAPPLVDIALGLSRQPRFGGQTRRWWSVLDHSLFVADLAAREGRGLRVILALLLHDAHEALTGDIPTSLKKDDMRDVQASLDERIMRE